MHQCFVGNLRNSYTCRSNNALNGGAYLIIPIVFQLEKIFDLMTFLNKIVPLRSIKHSFAYTEHRPHLFARQVNFIHDGWMMVVY